MNIVANKLLSSLNSWEKGDFEYGSTDCCQFASHVVKEITGEDHASSLSISQKKKHKRL